MHSMHLISNLLHAKPILQPDWHVEIPQRRTENSAQTLSLQLLLEVGSGHETKLWPMALYLCQNYEGVVIVRWGIITMEGCLFSCGGMVF